MVNMVISITNFLVLVTFTIIGANVHIDKIQLCDKQDYDIMWGLKIKNDGEKQIIEEGFMDSKIDVNNDILNKVSIYQQEGNKWNFIASKVDGVCSMIEAFLGEFVKGLETAAGLKQTCPYPKGKLEIKNYPLDFSNFKYKDFPAGTVKVVSEFYMKEDEKKIVSCYEVEFTLKV